ncbi:hypothetical protein [uncultured Tateyamaria sp.]|uniref:hypothetical protein n=1 Tax=uncultured Tateyamaria sp. TaxID=455651 RepID=UPI00262B762F|nr:hypothetical protein [uncultured Tateyamaria sp.]
MKVLLFLIYGDQRVYHLELTYSILSAWQYLKDDPEDIRIVLAADEANQRPDLPVDALLLSPQMMADWSMRGTYHHAIKLHVMHHALQKYAAPVAMIDSDTVFMGHPKHLFERFGPERALMHACEGPLENSAEWPEWKALIQNCGGCVTGRPISSKTIMHNAGVYGLMPEHASLMQTAVAILEDLRKHGSVFTAEQLAGSVALHDVLEIAECRDLIEHYWHGPRAYFHYQMGQMFHGVREGGGVADMNMRLPTLQRHIPSRPAHQVGARLKRLQRRAPSEYEFAYRAYLGARSTRLSDPELANVWALTALNMLTWGMPDGKLLLNTIETDFALFSPARLHEQNWMTVPLQKRWAAFWVEAEKGL